MGPGALVRRVSRALEQLSEEDRNAVLRSLLTLYPLTAMSNAERQRRFRSNDRVTVPRNDPRNASVTDSPTPPPSLLDPNFLAVNEGTTGNGKSQTGEYPKELQEIPELLRKLSAPAEFDDPQYWSRIDAWLGGDSGVFYLDELPKFLAHHQVQTGSKRHKNLRRAFRNWLAKSEYWSQQRAQTEAHRKARRY